MAKKKPNRKERKMKKPTRPNLKVALMKNTDRINRLEYLVDKLLRGQKIDVDWK